MGNQENDMSHHMMIMNQYMRTSIVSKKVLNEGK